MLFCLFGQSMIIWDNDFRLNTMFTQSAEGINIQTTFSQTSNSLISYVAFSFVDIQEP